jgi:hypothetical protein
MSRIACCALLAFFLTAPLLAEDPLPLPVNLSFEAGPAGAPPSGWGVSSSHEGAVVVQTVAEGCPEAAHCAKLTSKESGPGYDALLELVRADVYRGRRIRLRATIRKTEGVGKALLYIQVNRPDSHSETQTGQAAGASWRTDSLYIDVPKDAESIQFGLAVSGPSESWIDAVAVDIVGDAGLGNEPPRELTDRGAANLAAFARLVGLVRYFHPSDEAAGLDWSAWTIDAVGRVEGAQDTAELAHVLSDLVKPIAPTAQVFPRENVPLPIPPPSSPGARTLAWRHYGLGTGSDRSGSKFTSRRVGGFLKPESKGGALWILDAEALKGSTLQLAASARTERMKDMPSQAELWITAVDRENRSLAHDLRVVEGTDWQDARLSLSLPQNVSKVYFGARLIGGGRLFLDSFLMTTTGGPDGPHDIFVDGFEKDVPGAYPEGWLVSSETRGAGYRVTVTTEHPREGRCALLVAWDLDIDLPDPNRPLLVNLGSGISLRLPLALFADSQGTLPRSIVELSTRPKPEGFLPSAADRATRLADVVLLWTALDHFYPYPLDDWQPHLDVALRAAAKDTDELGFLSTLRRLIADLRDNHATVSHASDPADYRLPLLWRLIEGRLVVTWADPSLDKVRRGDIVESVDEAPALEALAKLEPLTSAATPAYRQFRALELLASGPKGDVRVLRLRRDKESFSVTIPITASLLGPDRLRGDRPERIAELRPGIFYLDLDRIDDEDFEAALPRLKKASGLIFDVRGYPERISETLLAHLIPAPIHTAGTWTAIRTRPDVPPILDHLSWIIQPLPPHLSSRAVFLADERAYSRAETYLDIVSFYHLGKIVGSTTGGTNGEVDDMDLSGGYHVTWTGNRVERLDGDELQGVGIPPTIRVEPTLAGVAAGRDEVLERAIALLQ